MIAGTRLGVNALERFLSVCSCCTFFNMQHLVLSKVHNNQSENLLRFGRVRRIIIFSIRIGHFPESLTDWYRPHVHLPDGVVTPLKIFNEFQHLRQCPTLKHGVERRNEVGYTSRWRRETELRVAGPIDFVGKCTKFLSCRIVGGRSARRLSPLYNSILPLGTSNKSYRKF